MYNIQFVLIILFVYLPDFHLKCLAQEDITSTTASIG